MKFFRYFISKTFFVNFGILLISSFILLFSTFLLLDVYTNHGESVSVPDFTGLTISEADNMAKTKNLQIKVIDSVFTDKVERGTIVDQIPSPNHKVKINRKIFITINSFSPQRVQMPNFVDLEMRSANALAETFGLKINVEKFVPDISTTILKQKFNGKEIKPNTWIEKGSVIDVIVGKGMSSEKVLVPSIVGLTKDEAEKILADLALMIGVVDYDESSVESSEDSANAKIYRQIPEKFKDSEIRVGGTIDIWLTTNEEIIPKPDTIKVDETEVFLE